MFDEIITVGITMLVIWLAIKIVTAPIKLGIKFLLNALSGFLLLVLCNVVGGIIGVTLPITWASASVAGLFGLPGVAVMLIMQIFS